MLLLLLVLVLAAAVWCVDVALKRKGACRGGSGKGWVVGVGGVS